MVLESSGSTRASNTVRFLRGVFQCAGHTPYKLQVLYEMSSIDGDLETSL